jgi:hypothetical protein
MTRTILLLSVLAACGDNEASYDLYDAEPAEFRTATLWVQPHPDVPPELARAACEAWRPEGVLCRLVDDPQEALIRIRAFTGACEELEDGNYPLGHARFGGEITLEIECLRRFGGTPPSEDVLSPTIAHEVGHVLGIWTHVPPDCGERDVPVHPEGGPVCGVAVMNPMIRHGLFGITRIDHYAYALRDEDLSVLRLAPHEGCTLVVRADGP